MTLQEQCALSYYQPIAELNAKHGVCLVQHTATKKVFVRKKLTTYDPDIYRYLMEHPIRNTPRIFEAVEDGSTLVIIEEYLSGSTLEEVLQERGSLPEEEVCELAIQLCQILKDLHHADPPIIHRDIKPSNLILSPDGVLKLLDMNAAKRAHGGTTSDTHLIGTAGYAAPEQYGFAASDGRTDIYAVGVLINELLNGGSGLRVNSADFRPVIDRCIQIDPGNRYQDINELADALQEVWCQQNGIRPEGKSLPRQQVTLPKPTARQFLPPGFRTGKIGKMLPAAALYLIWLWLCSLLTLDPPRFLSRCMVFLTGLVVIFFSGNYLDLQSQFPLSRSKNKLVRLIGILLWDIIIAYLLLTLFLILGLL